MHITVAICTWNRAALLGATLNAFQRLIVPAATTWELLIVDNNSTDETSDVIDRYTRLLPIRRIFEPTQGLSIARNRAIDEAAGDLILWTDDDVIVDPDWLRAYRDAAIRWPMAAYFGGEVDPWYEVDPPRWIAANLEWLKGMLVVRQLGDTERAFTETDSPGGLPYGANMAFRRWVFERQKFDPSCGYVGDRKFIGDETPLLIEFHAQGLQGVWVPAAKVKHFIPKKRATISYLKQYFYWMGRTTARNEAITEVARLWGAPRYIYRRYWTNLTRAMTARILGQPNWVELLILASVDRGQIDEFRQRMARGCSMPEEGSL